MALKFLSNVTHHGVLFKAGDIIASLDSGVQANLVTRKLAEETNDAPTHNHAEGDTSGRALPLDPVATPAEPTQAEIDAENARREQALQQQQADAARAAQAQVQASQPDAPEHQPTPAEVAATAAGIQ